MDKNIQEEYKNLQEKEKEFSDVLNKCFERAKKIHKNLLKTGSGSNEKIFLLNELFEEADIFKQAIETLKVNLKKQTEILKEEELSKK